jgi:hypothetical protein
VRVSRRFVDSALAAYRPGGAESHARVPGEEPGRQEPLAGDSLGQARGEPEEERRARWRVDEGAR